MRPIDTRTNATRLRLGVLVVLALVPMMGACGEDGGGPVAPEGTVLEGVVVLAGTQVLLPDVPVTMGERAVRSDARGSYRFDDVAVGEVTLRVSWPGYLLYERNLLIVQGVNTFDIALLPDD